VVDLAKWDEALYRTRLLKQASLDRMWTVYPLNDGKPNPAGYGFAWMMGDQNGHRRIEHGGAWQGFTCRIARYPDDSLTVVVLTNLDAGHADPGLIAHVVAGLADAPLMPAKLTSVPDDKPEIAVALGKILDKLVAREDIRTQATAELLPYLTPEAGASVKKRLEVLWPGGTLTLVRRTALPGAAGLFNSTFRLTKGSNSMLVNFGLNAEGKISGLGISRDREYQ